VLRRYCAIDPRSPTTPEGYGVAKGIERELRLPLVPRPSTWPLTPGRVTPGNHRPASIFAKTNLHQCPGSGESPKVCHDRREPGTILLGSESPSSMSDKSSSVGSGPRGLKSDLE
jgi:hypothetical protein